MDVFGDGLVAVRLPTSSACSSISCSSSSSSSKYGQQRVELTSLHCRKQRAGSGAVGGTSPYHACHGAWYAAGWQIQTRRTGCCCVSMSPDLLLLSWSFCLEIWQQKRLKGDNQPMGATNDDPAGPRQQPRCVETVNATV